MRPHHAGLHRREDSRLLGSSRLALQAVAPDVPFRRILQCFTSHKLAFTIPDSDRTVALPSCRHHLYNDDARLHAIPEGYFEMGWPSHFD